MISFLRSSPRQEAYASANDGVMTWDELLGHMDTLEMKWRDAIKDWSGA